MSGPSILTLARFYIPAFRAGGPVRTIANMVDRMGDELTFKVVTMDRDLGDSEAYDGICVNAWTGVQSAQVWYCSGESRWGLIRKVLHVVRGNQKSVLYLNSFFDPVFTIIPLFVSLFFGFRHPLVILAPRGELSTSALSIKKHRKSLYLRLFRLLGIQNKIRLQASSEFEAADIVRELGAKESNIVIAPDLLPKLSLSEGSNNRQPESHSGNDLRICFISRIAPIKNLDYTLRVLADVDAPIVFDIYGPLEDVEYWNHCQKLIEQMPSNIRVNYCDCLNHSEVKSTFGRYDLFLFPTQSENFGHVIFESMLAGTPVIVADTTPWRGLTKLGVGYDLPLSEPHLFVEAIKEEFNLDQDTRRERRETVRSYACKVALSTEAVDANRLLLQV